MKKGAKLNVKDLIMGASTSELVEMARWIQEAVLVRTGVTPEVIPEEPSPPVKPIERGHLRLIPGGLGN